jgi:glycosyltransferase involved in cell wall biosynthesis
MRIGFVLYDLQEFGGLEEFVTGLAVGLRQLGHQTCVISTAWVYPDNQYLKIYRRNNIPYLQLPKWISLPASDWSFKSKILAITLKFLSPLMFLLAGALFFLRRRPWRESLASAHNWLRGQLMSRFIGPDRRKPLSIFLLEWWRFYWRPDILHIHGYTNTTLFVIDWAHTRGLPIVYEEHQTPDSHYDWWQNFQSSINKADTVVAVSEKSAQALSEVCGVTKPIVVRNNYVADPIASGWRDNNRASQNDQPVMVTTVARLYITKGLVYLLEAIVRVKSTHPNTQFRVYGSGILREELLIYASQLGLDGNQIFVGAFNHHELPNIMSRTDIFVLSSIMEGQPLCVIEAMAYGRPIVSTNVGGIPEIIKDGENGLLCRPKDPECLAQKIRILIDKPELRQKLGSAARKTYELGPFQPSSVYDHYISTYMNVLRSASIKNGRQSLS